MTAVGRYTCWLILHYHYLFVDALAARSIKWPRIYLKHIHTMYVAKKLAKIMHELHGNLLSKTRFLSAYKFASYCWCSPTEIYINSIYEYFKLVMIYFIPTVRKARRIRWIAVSWLAAYMLYLDLHTFIGAQLLASACWLGLDTIFQCHINTAFYFVVQVQHYSSRCLPTFY